LVKNTNTGGEKGIAAVTNSFLNRPRYRCAQTRAMRAGIVEKEEEYLYSSCGDFYGTRKGLLELVEF